MTGDRGSVTAFVVAIMASLMALVGLVYDGGRLVAAQLRVADQAASAARAGAQELTGLRAGEMAIDVPAALRRARHHLHTDGVTGTVEATPNAVMVTARAGVTFQLLALVGVASREVSASRTAVVVRQ